MESKKTAWILIVVLLLLVGGASVLYAYLVQGNPTNQLDTRPESATDASGQQEDFLAPDFTVYDKDGKEVKLSDFKGKPVVINFWASWCHFCKVEMPDFDKVYKELGEEIQFLMINVTDGHRETQASADRFLEGTGYTFPVFYDSKLDAAGKYGANSLPLTYFVDAQGNLITRARGAINEESLRRGIDMIRTQN